VAKGVTKQSIDYAKWYTDVVLKGELADYGPVKGTMVIRPYGYALWENIRTAADALFKETGHVNAYFPLFIPKSYLSREADHVEGFAKECAVVTHYRLKNDPEGNGIVVDDEAKLEEELVIRPTSETIIWAMYKKWINSYRDLPILINQWANVVRWEMRTRLFLRTTEFLWQEGHTAHATAAEAHEEALTMIDIYRKLAEEYLAMPVYVGEKTEAEKFAGAEQTYAIEAMMGDMKALQAGTSHDLGQNFAKAFDVTFLNRKNQQEYVYATSWGVSTRLVGGVIMVHGDDKGLILPPKVAPHQVVIVPIWKSDDQKARIMEKVSEIKRRLQARGLRVLVDDNEQTSPGWKFNQWEMKGVPLRIEIGPKDLEQDQVVIARRDLGTKEFVRFDMIADTVEYLESDIQQMLYERAQKFRDENTHTVKDYAELKEVVDKGGFAKGWWAGSSADEEVIQTETKATIRCIPFRQPGGQGRCLYTGQPADKIAIFAKAY